MQRLNFFSAMAVLTIAMAGCATQPEPQGSVITAVHADDGSIIAVDENGNEVKDSPEADLLLGLVDALQPSPLEDHEIWSVDGDGNLTHIQSGGICPYEWGEFTLIKPTIFNRNGFDVGCNYQSVALEASYTFYFYVNSEPIEQELDGVVSAIQSRTPTAQAVDLNFLGPAPRYYAGRALESSVDGGSVKRDSVLLMEKAGWRIKLRMTYEATDAIEREHLAAIMLKGQADRVGRDGIGDGPSQDGEDSPELET